MLLLAKIAYQENGGQQKATVIRDVRPQCQSSKFKKNGHIRNGKGMARSRWGAERVAVVRNASPVMAIMTKTGRPSPPGSVARGQSFYRRPEISRCRQCNGQPISRCKRAVGSILTLIPNPRNSCATHYGTLIGYHVL
jgi:hypothetical protein